MPSDAHSMDLLRLITCGSVDDGKSTLIGRLLYDSKGIYQDQWEAVHRTSMKRGDARVDLALLTDGLRAEREQGITIDVAYRYFSTPRRKFILADTPGHVQYTRNMATGASTAGLAIILIDARQGVLEQTRRHSYIASMLGIRQFVVAINKMDLVEWSRPTFEKIAADFAQFTARGGNFTDVNTVVIPVSALQGDNIVTRSNAAPWYSGPALLEHLEQTPPRTETFAKSRFNVQCVNRPHSDAPGLHDYRGYAGQVAAGTFAVGDDLVALPAGQRSRIKRIHLGSQEFTVVGAGRSVAIELQDDVDVSRGDVLVKEGQEPTVAREFDAELIWMSEQQLTPARKYIVKHGTRTMRAILGPVRTVLDLHSLEHKSGSATLSLNEIGVVRMRLASTIAFDRYADCRGTGSFIVIDEATNNTVAAGMIC